MRILLIGEYSRLHNSLKEGLLALGHQVVLVSSGDLFKNYPSDISIRPQFSNHKLVMPFRKILFRLFRYDCATTEKGLRFYANLNKMHNFDVVQLINEYAIETQLPFEKFLLKKIIKQNKKMFVLACGDDYITNTYYLAGKMRYSVLTPYLNDKSKFKTYQYSLKYTTKAFEKLHDFVFEQIAGIIPTDLDYAIPYQGVAKALPMIPNPINLDKINYQPLKIGKKIIIFHGVNTMNYYKKGNDLIDEALAIIQNNYADKVTIIRAESLPYDEYIKLYDSAHIIMDQIYAFDQGYNALEAMAKGKVVCTGAEREFEAHYKLKDKVAINLRPDVNEIVQTLEALLANPKELIAIGKRARLFIEQHHDYKTIAARYVSAWNGTN